MDEPKIPLPPWLPWATTACLAAMVACLGELWLVEKARGRLLRDQNLMATAALRGTQNQLEAERILGRRELGEARAASGPASGLEIELLSAQEGGTEPEHAKGPVWGVVVWEAGGTRAILRTSGVPAAGPGRDYQLWLDGPGQDYPVDCGTLGAGPPGSPSEAAFVLTSPVGPGCRFLLVECAKGAVRTLGEARSGGSIVLASLPHTESIPTR